MKSVLIIVLSFFFGQLHAQYGSLAVFEKGTDQQVTTVRIFPVKCTVFKMDDSAYVNLLKSVNNYMHLDGAIVYTAFYIPFTGYSGAREFAIDEYIGKKQSKKVRFIEENEEILLDNGGNVVVSAIKEKPAGVMVIYYADYSPTAGSTVIHSAYGYSVYSKSPINKQEVAKTLSARVLGSTKYTFEWQPGMTIKQVERKIGPGIVFRDNGEYRIE